MSNLKNRMDVLEREFYKNSSCHKNDEEKHLERKIIEAEQEALRIMEDLNILNLDKIQVNFGV